MATKKAAQKKPDDSPIVMVRESDGKEANVHPNEVKNFEKGGYKPKK